jgi:hypothetical protein
MATSTSQRSPGVKTGLLEKRSWNPLTPGRVPCGARISAGHGGIIGKLRTGELHAITTVTGKFYYYIGKSFLFTGHEKKFGLRS